MEFIPAPPRVPQLDPEATELLREVLEVYGDHSAKKLEMLTHSEKPWRDARGDLPPEARSDAVIPKEAMRAFYGSLRTRLASA
jgi:uncharacterized phage-associated protein